LYFHFLLRHMQPQDKGMAASPEGPTRIGQLVTELALPQPMRRGSLSERTIKCGKAGCACAGDPKAHHGPYFSLTQAVGGKTQSRFLTAERAAMAQQQIAARRQFRQRVNTYWDACEQWADPEIKLVPSASTGRPKKGLPTELHRDIVQEIEALLASPSIRDLDFEAVEMAARRQALRLAARDWNSGGTPTTPIMMAGTALRPAGSGPAS
jgi:hypothetical protein